MSEITIDDIDKKPGITPDLAAARSRSYEFKGKPLRPFSFTRSTAARCMGNSLFLGRAKPGENGLWPEVTMDSIIVLWLCSVDDSRALRACIKSDEALRDAMAWWEIEGGNMGSREEIEAISLLNSIAEDIMTVSATIESGPGARDSSTLGE